MDTLESEIEKELDEASNKGIKDDTELYSQISELCENGWSFHGSNKDYSRTVKTVKFLKAEGEKVKYLYGARHGEYLLFTKR